MRSHGRSRAGGGFRETHRMEQCNVLLANGQPAVLYASFQDGDERLCPYHPLHGEYLKTHAPEVRTGNIALRLR